MSKELKAKVTLDVASATKKLDLLAKKINAIDKAVNKRSSASKGIIQQIQKATQSANALQKQVNKVDSANRKASNSAKTMADGYKKSNSEVSLLTTKLKRLASTYLGVLGAKAFIGTSDVITSAENRLNALPEGYQNNTQESLDKMYTAAQRARVGYADMMGNVSKSMTLAPDSFQGNIDNAIRFQEIMGKTYALGGASAAEQSASMYQMIQALGSGVLQGDELRSVREGAPLAYQAIEKFAQGVYGAENNLKDLASEGKITSDIVVAAIMSMGDEIDKKFEDTSMTFAQAWEMIKNTAVKSFEPLLQMLNDTLNSDFGQSIVSGIIFSLQFLAGVLQVVFGWFNRIYGFVVNNWPIISKVLLIIASITAIALLPQLMSWLSYLGFIIMYYAYLAGVAVASAIKTAAAWAMANLPLFILLSLLALAVVVIIWVSDSFVDACGNIIGAFNVVWQFFLNGLAWLGNMFMGLLTVVTGVFTNIGIAMYNTWQGAKASFWEWVSECLNGTGLIAQAISKIASLFGLDSVSIDTKISAANAKKMDYVDIGDAWNQGNSVFGETFQSGWATDAFNSGYKTGSSGGQWITDKLSGIGDAISGKLNIGNLPDYKDPTSPLNNLWGSYDPSKALKGINGIEDDTGDIKDSMNLTEEDLEYLRKVAEMEWKKEFTTANITVDMSNYNTINGDSDLDGIVTKLTSKLYEELDSVANGVYV